MLIPSVLLLAFAEGAAGEVDLRPKSFTFGSSSHSGIYHQGDPVRITWDVHNYGDETSDSFTVDFYVGDYYIGSETRPALEPGRSVGYSSTSAHHLPDDIPYGNHTVKMEITTSNDSNQGNNSRSAHSDLTVVAVKPADPYLEETQDLVRTWPAVSIYHPGETIHIAALVRNYGDEPFGVLTAYVYADSYLLGSEDFSPNVIHTSTFHVSMDCKLPDNLALGEYSISIEIVSSDDSNPDNNSATHSTPITVGPAASDLFVYDIGIRNKPSDSVYYPGDSITIECDVWNLGRTASVSYTADIYLGDYLLGSVERSPLGAAEEEEFTQTWELTEDLPEGRYIVGVSVTCANDDDARGGDNSKRRGSIEFARKAPPEVTVTCVDAAKGIYKPGDSIKVTVEAECGDGQLPGTLGLDFYASTDDKISTADYRIGSRDFSNLEPEESYTFNTSCYFPHNIPAGNYYIGVVVDYPNHGDVAYDGVPLWVGAAVDLSVQTVNATDGTYLPSEQIQVYSLVKNKGEGTSEGYTIDFYLSTDTVISATDTRIGYVERSGLASSAQHSYETSCQLPINLPAGKLYIGAIVTYAKDNDPANNTGLDTAAIHLIHPAGYVCGRVDYPDKYKNSHPIRYAYVGIYAEDKNDNPLDDHLLGQTHTDQKGDYAVILPNDGQAAGSIYVKVLTQGVSGAYPESTSRICVLRDAVLKETYSLSSAVHPHPQAASGIINLTSPSQGGFMVFDSITEGFCKAKTALDIEMPEISVYWPSEDGDTYFDPCNLEIHVSRDDRRDRDVIMHEYGHYIADIYGVGLGPVGDNPIHFWDLDLRQEPVWRSDEHAMNLAFREAWATVFCIASQFGDSTYPGSGDSKYDDGDEGASWANKVDLKNYNTGQHSPGQYFENMNAGALWDIFSIINSGVSDDDAPAEPSLSMIWAISRDYKPDNIIGFWNSWFQEYDYEQKLRSIFSAHGMSFAKPGE